MTAAASATMIPMITGMIEPLGLGGVTIVVFVLVVEVRNVAVEIVEPVRKVVDVVTVETIVVVNVPVRTVGVERRIVESASVPPNDCANAEVNSGSDPTIHPEFGSVR